ncbi:MAG: biopolymer transporter ExbD [Alphaproteobacteria bacterium]|nr:biopolymer transporter ExbD [Alphaproteobacteria bacterium]
MKLVSQRRRSNEDDRILPLINVVFLLLIFFMLAGRLSPGDPFRIDPPVSINAGKVEIDDLLVQVGADGRLALNGEETTLLALEPAISAHLKAGLPATVRLKADGAVAASEVIAIMELLREAGVDSLKLLTVPAGGG